MHTEENAAVKNTELAQTLHCEIASFLELFWEVSKEKL